MEAITHCKNVCSGWSKAVHGLSRLNLSEMLNRVVEKAAQGHKLCVYLQEILAATAGGALHLKQRQAAPAASQLHRRALRLRDPHQGRPAFPARPLPAVPLLHTSPGCSSGLLTSPGAPHVLSLMLTPCDTTASASCILSCAV